jgi:hypothetical protein
MVDDSLGSANLYTKPTKFFFIVMGTAPKWNSGQVLSNISSFLYDKIIKFLISDSIIIDKVQLVRVGPIKRKSSTRSIGISKVGSLTFDQNPTCYRPFVLNLASDFIEGSISDLTIKFPFVSEAFYDIHKVSSLTSGDLLFQSFALHLSKKCKFLIQMVTTYLKNSLLN